MFNSHFLQKQQKMSKSHFLQKQQETLNSRKQQKLLNSLSTSAAENVKISLSTKASQNVELSKAAGNVKLSLSTSAVAAATARADTAVWGGELLLVLCHGILVVERDCIRFFDNKNSFWSKDMSQLVVL